MKVRAVAAALAASTLLTLAACGSPAAAGSSPGPTAGASTSAAHSQHPADDMYGALSATAASQITGTTFTTSRRSRPTFPP